MFQPKCSNNSGRTGQNRTGLGRTFSKDCAMKPHIEEETFNKQGLELSEGKETSFACPFPAQLPDGGSQKMYTLTSAELQT